MSIGTKSMDAMRSFAIIAALSTLVVGCGFDLGFKDKSSPPLATTVSAESISIYEGIAIGVAVLDGDDPVDSSDSVSLSIDDPILGIEPTNQQNEFVVFGVAPGKTTVHVMVNGEEEASIPAEVRMQ